MMLIDADALIKTLETYKFGAIQNEVERAYIKETVINFVKDAPTVYDPEKVVAELDDKFERTVAEILDKTGSDFTIADFNIKRYSDRICEIVRKGGVT